MKKFWHAIIILSLMTVFSFFLDSQVNSAMPGLRSPLMDSVMFFFTGLGGLSIGLPFIIIAILLLEYEHKNKIAVNFLLALVIDLIVTAVIKLLTDRERPANIRDPTDFTEAYMSSFPSAHSSRAFTMFNTLNHYLNHPLIFYSIAAMIAFSRVYFGVHYLSDVMAGIVIGLIISHEVCTKDLGSKIIRRFKNKR